MSLSGPWAVGIDVGGTKIAAGTVSLASGAVDEQIVIPTNPDRPGEAILTSCVEVAARLIDHGQAAFDEPATGIGIGVPEILDPEGNITSEYSVPWKGLAVVESLSAVAPTRIEMDQNTAALAEARFGAGVGFDPFLYVTVGTGLGCTLVQGGVPYSGARNAAGVFANGPYSTTCPGCGHEHEMVLDELASGPALERRYSRAVGRVVHGAEEVLEAARGGEPEAVSVVRSGGRALGARLALLVDVLDPAAVVVGGGLGLAGGLYADEMESAMREHIWSDPHRDIPLLKAGLGVDAGLIGAATAAGLFGPSRRQRSAVDDKG